jgi:pimeloyl-ACP methyl ester carboxylesterase
MLYLLLIIAIAIALLSLVRLDKRFQALVPLYTDSQSSFFVWKGINVHFKDEGHGIPIILLHGTSSSLHTWDKLASSLKRYYRIIRMDLPGFGLTGPRPDRDYSLNAYVQFINAFAQHLEVSRFILAGNSWGGLLAWYYSSQHQQKVLGLILIDAAGHRMSKIPKRFVACGSILGRWAIRHTMFKKMVKMGLQEAYGNPHLIDDAMVKRYRDLMLREGNRLAFLDFVKVRKWPDLRLLSIIHSPTLILWGRLDHIYNVEQAFAFKKILPHAALAIVENAGHVPMEEEPDICARHILEFINTQVLKSNF